MAFLFCARADSSLTVRPTVLVSGLRAPDVSKAVAAANRELLVRQIATARKQIESGSHVDTIRQELESAVRRLSHWSPEYPLPPWVEIVVLVEREHDWAVVFYPRNGGLIVDADRETGNVVQRFAVLLSKETYEPVAPRDAEEFRAFECGGNYREGPEKFAIRTNYQKTHGFIEPFNLPVNNSAAPRTDSEPQK